MNVSTPPSPSLQKDQENWRKHKPLLEGDNHG